MMNAIWLHLLQSTLFALCLGALYFCLPRAAASLRYLALLAAAMKFAVPVAALMDGGRPLASMRGALPAGLPVLPAEVYSALAISRALPEAAQKAAVPTLLAVVWLLGTAGLLVLWLVRWRKSVSAAEDGSETENAALKNALERLPLRQQVAIMLSERTEVSLRGLWRPVVQIPRRVSLELSSPEREAVLLHELAHAYRRDNFWSMAIHLVVCCFWFHPLMWWLEMRLAAEREVVCDQMVVSCGTDPDVYVSGMLKVCRHQLTPSVAGTSGVAGSNLKKRCDLIFSYPKQAVNFLPARFFAAAAVALVVGLPLAAGLSRQSNDVQGCVAGERYAEGTVVRMGSRTSAPVRECSQSSWIPTKKPATVVIQDLPPFICQPISSVQKNLCSCQGHGTFSLGAVVAGSAGGLRCDSFKLGDFSTWRPLTDKELASFRH